MIIKTRVIPVLLLQDGGLVKTSKFDKPVYVGDPINSVRIFNEKEVDELVFLDISATPENQDPNFEMLEDIASEAFMPMAYGGGIKTFEQAKRIFSLGFEKVVLNNLTFTSPDTVKHISSVYGAQSVVACLDVKRSLFGEFDLYTHSGKNKQSVGIAEHLSALEEMKIGEVIINSINRDGTQKGYDLTVIKQITDKVSIPVVACGGAGTIEDFSEAVNKGGASAVAAGSMFVFRGKHRAVLISYPEGSLLVDALP